MPFRVRMSRKAGRSVAYVINLDSRPDRWAAIQKRFEGSDLLLRRIPAVKHQNGAYGNFMSFLKAFRMAKREGLESVLILEDDVVPARGWEAKWRDVRSWLDTHPEAWDIYSGGAWGGPLGFQNATGAIGLEPAAIGHAKQNHIFKYPILTVGAHWVYVPRRTLSKAIRLYSRLQFLPKLSSLLGMDVLHGFFFKTVSSYPFIARQRASYSNITRRHRDRDSFFETSERRLKRSLTRRT